MSVQDILMCASFEEEPTQFYDTMPIRMKSLTNDSTWTSICYDGVDTFAAIRQFKNRVSFSRSAVPGEIWYNANTSGELLDSVGTGGIYTSISGNAGTFIITLNQGTTTDGSTIIQRLVYDPNTELYVKSAPIKVGGSALPATATVQSTVPSDYRHAYCSAYGNGVFVVGGHNWLAYSKDDGVTWTVIPTTYDIMSIVYGEAKTASGTRVPRFLFTTSVPAPNETVGYCTFSASKDLTIVTTQVTGSNSAKVAYADGIFMINISTSNRRDFLYTEDLESFKKGPQIQTSMQYNYIIDKSMGTGNIVGAGNYFIVVPALLSIYVEPVGSTNIYLHPTTNSVGVVTGIAANKFTYSERMANNFGNQYVYRLSTTRTSTGWTAAWESIPLTYSSQELVENWPVVAPETDVSVYGRSAVGPYKAVCYGKDRVLAPRYLGDKLTIIDPTVT